MAKKSSDNRKKQAKSEEPETVDLVIEDAEVVTEVSAADVDAIEEETAEESTAATHDDVPENLDTEVENIAEADSYQETPAVQPVEKRQNTFIPLVLGGLVAGAIGYGIATLQRDDNSADLEALIAAQSGEIENLKGEVAALAAAPQDDGITDSVAALDQSLTALGLRIDESLVSLDERMTVIEKQPSADGTLQEAAIAAYERDIAELRDQISAQQEEMRGLLTATREEAQAIEENAIASARNATARASLAIVQGALETGAPMGAALNDLDGATADAVPEALVAAKDGVATLSSLQSDFPSLARNALATARSEGASGEESGGLGGFFRNQFDVRSVEPQEGDSADAILSRSEAALREGRLNDTLAELASLPEVARAELSEWIAQAEQRAAAIDAAASLASQLNVN